MKILGKRGDYNLIDDNNNYKIKHHGKIVLLTRHYELAVEFFLQETKEV